jgi:hypothetical protein
MIRDKFLADIIWVIHIIFMSIVFLGPFLLPVWTLPYQLIIVPITMALYIYFGHCCLSKFECNLRGIRHDNKQFINSIALFIDKYFGTNFKKDCGVVIGKNQFFVGVLVAWFILFGVFISHYRNGTLNV